VGTICEAMSRPGMRFVPVKSADEQAALMLLKRRYGASGEGKAPSSL
jgi:transposase